MNSTVNSTRAGNWSVGWKGQI